MDQIAAQELRKHTPLASLELGLEGANRRLVRHALQLRLLLHISWASGSTPLPMEHNPRASSSGCSATTTAPTRARRAAGRRRSILDSVRDDVARLQRDLGAGDRVKVGAYLDAVRDVERRIEIAEAQRPGGTVRAWRARCRAS